MSNNYEIKDLNFSEKRRKISKDQFPECVKNAREGDSFGMSLCGNFYFVPASWLDQKRAFIGRTLRNNPRSK